MASPANLDTNRTQMSALVSSSQSATGALQPAQAGNQILRFRHSSLPISPPPSPRKDGRRVFRRPSKPLPKVRRRSSSAGP